MPANAANTALSTAPAAKPPAPRPARPIGRNPTIVTTPEPPAAGEARIKRRHWRIVASFIVGVLVPVVAIAWYLWGWASDQYASTVAFSVRTENSGGSGDLLGSLSVFSGSSSSDTDILYEYLQSQKLVADIDAQIDLRAMWSRPENDPVFAFDETGTIEDLVTHWERMVKIYYDESGGLIEVRALAFTPEDAQRIAQTLFEQSSDIINELSDIAREDAIRFAAADVEIVLERLKSAREAVTEFRNLNQVVDPSVDLQSQASLLGNLQSQLAEALIELDLLSSVTLGSDPRRTQGELRIKVIEDRIAEERRKLGLADGSETDPVYANLFGEYERLVVEREFAEQAYNSALAAYDLALAEARRQSRYLAAYVQPTLAESSRFPERGVLLTLSTLLIFLVWSTAILIAYALKDRR